MLKNFITKIERLHDFTSHAAESENFSLIDKDIILQNLRELYLEASTISIFDQVGFGDEDEKSIVFEIESPMQQDTDLAEGLESTSEQVVSFESDINGLENLISQSKKLLIKEQLCDGDDQQYNILIRKLNKIDDFDNAMVYIYDQYPEKLNCEAIAILAEILTSKML